MSLRSNLESAGNKAEDFLEDLWTGFKWIFDPHKWDDLIGDIADHVSHPTTYPFHTLFMLILVILIIKWRGGIKRFVERLVLYLTVIFLVIGFSIYMIVQLFASPFRRDGEKKEENQ